MASINNLAATGDIFVKVGEPYGGSSTPKTSTTTTDSTTEITVAESNFFYPLGAGEPTALNDHAIVFGGTDPKLKGKIKTISSVTGGETVTVSPNFNVPTGTPFTVHKPELTVSADGLNLHSRGAILNPGEGGQTSYATRDYVDTKLFAGKFVVWNYLHVWEPESGQTEFGIVSDGEAILADIASAVITVGGDIQEPFKDYNFVENSTNTGSVVVFGTAPTANVVIRATVGSTENLNAGVDHIETIASDGERTVKLPFAIYDKNSTMVTVDGVVQSSPANYMISRGSDTGKLDTVNFQGDLLANSVVRVVNLKGAAFLGNYSTSVILKDDTVVNQDSDGNDILLSSNPIYSVPRERLLSKGSYNIYADTTDDLTIMLPPMTWGENDTTDDGIRIKITKSVSCNGVIVSADGDNFFHYEGQTFGSLEANGNGGMAKNYDQSHVSKLDIEWEAAFNTWVINKGIGLWTVDRG